MIASNSIESAPRTILNETSSLNSRSPDLNYNEEPSLNLREYHKYQHCLK